MDTKKDKEFADEYLSSLVDLTYNSKPLIDMLTILAEENIEHGQVIVDAVELHISKVKFLFANYKNGKELNEKTRCRIFANC